MFPTAPGRRFGPTVLGPRRAAIISGPTGGRRCPRYGTLLKRGLGVRSSWSRSGSFNGLPRPGVARELPSTVQSSKGEVFMGHRMGHKLVTDGCCIWPPASQTHHCPLCMSVLLFIITMPCVYSPWLVLWTFPVYAEPQLIKGLIYIKFDSHSRGCY
jgi:hypothetical protein